jgi:eukaryotic-like serine/threonine-protein kinase
MLDFPKIAESQLDNGNQTVRFGSFEADLRSGEIRKSGSRIKLQDQPFKVLQVLLERPGDLVTREELQSRIWPEESFGDFDHAVNVAVGKLRAALGDSAESPSFIQTVPRRGYRFVAQLDPAALDEATSSEAFSGASLRPQPGARYGFKRIVLASVAIILAAGVLVTLGAFLERHATRSQPPDFQRLTVRRGTVYSARFAPDGRSIVYAASWDGSPIEIFTTDPKLPGTRSLGLPGTQLLAISRAGKMAVLQPADHRLLTTFRGTLGQLPLTGGSPRQLAENIEWADWAPDGVSLAAVRVMGGKQVLEFPLGHVLYQTSGWITHPRISPRGDQVAFLDHPSYPDDRGTVSIVDLAGHRKVLSAESESVEGLAWSADGTQVWFSAAQVGNERSIYRIDLSGHQRLILRAPGGVTLQDLAPDGRVLLTRDDYRVGMIGLPPATSSSADSKRERELSWEDWSVATGISSDGNTVLFDEQGAEAGPNYTVALRDTSGSPPVALGEGMAGDLSPDGKWATTVVGNARLLLLPTGAGTARELDRGNVQQYWHAAFWMPDSKQIVFSANLPGHAVQCFIQNIETGTPRPVTPEGVSYCQVSSDGRLMAGYRVGVGGWLYGIDGGEPRVIPGLRPGEFFGWSSDPRVMYVYDGKHLPVRVYRLNILTGERQLFKEVTPPDLAGLSEVSHMHFSSDGRAYVYSYTRLLSELYLVTGIKPDQR